MSRATTNGVWLIAKTWAHGWYPCRCKPGRECWTSISDPDGHPAYWCPCWGRLDLEKLPAHCCAPNHPFHATKEATHV